MRNPFLPLRRWLRVALLLTGLACAPGWAAAQTSAADSPITLTQARLFITPDATPPPQTQAGWQAVMLPDVWPVSRYVIADNGWYRFVVNRKSPPAQWGIFLPRLNMNAAVYFNGQFLGDGGSFAQPLGRNWSRPLYFKIPDSGWRAGDNILDVRLRSDAGAGLLAPLRLGPHSVIAPQYEQAYFFQILLTAGLFIITLVVALFFFGLWLKRRSDSQYGWFALTAFVWSILSLNHFISTIPVSPLVWDWLIFSAIAWWTTGLAMFVHRYVGYRNATIEAALIFYAMSAMVLYASAGRYLWVVAPVWMAGSIWIGGYAVWRLWVYRQTLNRLPATAPPALATAPRGSGWLALGIAAVLLVGIHDWAVQNGVFYGFSDNYAYHHLLPYSASVLILFIGWHLNRRFIDALNDAEQLNVGLEVRIAANRRELERSYLQLRKLEHGRAAATERERIYRDLHDGLGGITTNISLLSELAQQETSPASVKQKLATISELSREGLDEIRGFMRNLDDAEGDWQSVAADLRLHGHKLLEPYAIAFHFSATVAPNLPNADSVLRFNLFRIYKEALTNVIKHAQAKNVRVKIEIAPQQLLLEIEDDGIGLAKSKNDAVPADEHPSDPAMSGRGLPNLKTRALNLGGTLSLRAAGTQRRGTHIFLRVPLPLKYPESGVAQ